MPTVAGDKKAKAEEALSDDSQQRSAKRASYMQIASINVLLGGDHMFSFWGILSSVFLCVCVCRGIS